MTNRKRDYSMGPEVGLALLFVLLGAAVALPCVLAYRGVARLGGAA